MGNINGVGQSFNYNEQPANYRDSHFGINVTAEKVCPNVINGPGISNALNPLSGTIDNLKRLAENVRDLQRPGGPDYYDVDGQTLQNKINECADKMETLCNTLTDTANQIASAAANKINEFQQKADEKARNNFDNQVRNAQRTEQQRQEAEARARASRSGPTRASR